MTHHFLTPATLAQKLNLLIWREKKYGQYLNIMHIKLNQENSTVAQCFPFLGTTLIFFTMLLHTLKTVLASFTLVSLYDKAWGAYIVFQIHYSTYFHV